MPRGPHGTRSQLRTAGIAALFTAVALAISLILEGGGVPASDPDAVLAWHATNATQVQASTIAWLVAMLGLVAFAVGFREAMWATVLDRAWLTVVFVHGAGVFATVVVVAAAVRWALAAQAGAAAIGPDLAGTIWALERTLVRFAAWGLTAPLLVVGAALARHNVLGQVCAVSAVLVAGALLVPLTWEPALWGFCVWMGLVGVALVAPTLREGRAPRFVPASWSATGPGRDGPDGPAERG